MNTIVDIRTNKNSNGTFTATVSIALSSNEKFDNGRYLSDYRTVVTATRRSRGAARNAVKNHVLYYRRNKEAAYRMYSALEDMAILKNEGALAVCNTANGTYHLEYNEGTVTGYVSRSYNDTTDLNPMTYGQAAQMLAKAYIVE